MALDIAISTSEPFSDVVEQGVHEARRPRGRPRKIRRNSPERRSFELIATATVAIPAAGGAWFRAKEEALARIDADLALAPADRKLMRAMLVNLNHKTGFDFGGRPFYADKCGVHEDTVRKSMKWLQDHGHILRRRVPRRGAYDHWQTAFPVIVVASEIAERNREAGNSKVGGQIIDFPAPHGRPTGLLIPWVEEVEEGRESERRSNSLGEKEASPNGEVPQGLPTLEQRERFNGLFRAWGTALDRAATDAILRDALRLALRKERPDDVEAALATTLGICAEEASQRTGRGHLTSYFGSTFAGQLGAIERQRLAHEAELALIPERKRVEHEATMRIADAKVATEERIGQRRLNAFGNSFSVKRGSHARADRSESVLPEDWKPTTADFDWVRQHYVARDCQIEDEAEKFRTYHHSVGSMRANWSATWKVWWRKDQFHGYHKRTSAVDAAHKRRRSEEYDARRELARRLHEGELT